MWEPFLWLALFVRGWRWLTSRGRSRPIGPFPDIGDAPAHAEPMVATRLDDNGLATYSIVLPQRPRRAVTAREGKAAPRRRLPPTIRLPPLARPTADGN